MAPAPRPFVELRAPRPHPPPTPTPPRRSRAWLPVAIVGGIAIAGALVLALAGRGDPDGAAVAQQTVLDAGGVDAGRAPPAVRVALGDLAGRAAQPKLRAWIAGSLQRYEPTWSITPEPSTDATFTLAVAVGETHAAAAGSETAKPQVIECEVAYRLLRGATLLIAIENRGFAYRSDDALATAETCARAATDAAIPHFVFVMRGALGVPVLTEASRRALASIDAVLDDITRDQSALAEAAQRIAGAADTDVVRSERARIAIRGDELAAARLMALAEQAVLTGTLPILHRDVSMLVLRRDCEQALALATNTTRSAGVLATPLLEEAMHCVELPGATAPRPDRRILVGEGLIALARNDNVLARDRFRAALAIAPRDVDVLLGLAEAELRTSDIDGAFEHSSRAIDVAPHDARPLLVRARVHLAFGSWENAITDYQRVLDVHGDLPEARLNLARIRGSTRRL